MEQHDTTKMTNALKKALKGISSYKKENDKMYKQLSTQEKDIRKLRLEFSKKAKAAKVKEKKRARAMFSGDEQEKKDPEKIEMPTIRGKAQIPIQSSLERLSIPKITTNEHSVRILDEADTIETETKDGKSTTKKATTSAESEEDDDDFSDPAFFEEHREALSILSAITIGWLVLKMITRKNIM